jgi:hypothetical protein
MLRFRAAGTAGIVPARAHAQPGPDQTPVRATCHDAITRKSVMTDYTIAEGAVSSIPAPSAASLGHN